MGKELPLGRKVTCASASWWDRGRRGDIRIACELRLQVMYASVHPGDEDSAQSLHRYILLLPESLPQTPGAEKESYSPGGLELKMAKKPQRTTRS